MKNVFEYCFSLESLSSLLQLPNIQSITGSDGVICVGVNVHPIDEMSVKRVGFLLKRS